MSILKWIFVILFLGFVGAFIYVIYTFFSKTYPKITEIGNAIDDLKTTFANSMDNTNKCLKNKDVLFSKLADIRNKLNDLNNLMFGSVFVTAYKSYVDDLETTINSDNSCK